jgi:hypothetical protein
MVLKTLGMSDCPTRATEDYPACAKRITTDSTIHGRSPSSYLYLFFLADTLITLNTLLTFAGIHSLFPHVMLNNEHWAKAMATTRQILLFSLFGYVPRSTVARY